MCFQKTFTRFSPAPVGLASRSRLRGTQGARLYTTAQVSVPGGLRGACSGTSNSRNLAVVTGLLSEELDPSKTTEKPNDSHCCKAQQHVNNNRFKLSSVLQLRTLLCVCGPLLYMCGHDVCVCTGLSTMHSINSTRLLRVGKDAYSSRCTVNIFSSSCIYLNGA